MRCHACRPSRAFLAGLRLPRGHEYYRTMGPAGGLHLQTSQVPAALPGWICLDLATVLNSHLSRDEYTASDLPGGLSGTFKLKGKEYLRRDIQLVRQSHAS